MNVLERLRREHAHGDGISRWMAENARDRELASWCRYTLRTEFTPAERSEIRDVLVPIVDDNAGLAQPAGLTGDERLTLAIKKYEARKNKKKERP